jgi:hypothetical protein
VDWLVWLLRELESEEALAVMGRDHESKVASQTTVAGWDSQKSASSDFIE